MARIKAFFSLGTLSALGGVASSVGGLLGPSGPTPEQQALEASKQRTFQAAENQKTRALGAQQQGLQVQRQAAQDRAQALDRIIQQFQQGLGR